MRRQSRWQQQRRRQQEGRHLRPRRRRQGAAGAAAPREEKRLSQRRQRGRRVVPQVLQQKDRALHLRQRRAQRGPARRGMRRRAPPQQQQRRRRQRPRPSPLPPRRGRRRMERAWRLQVRLACGPPAPTCGGLSAWLHALKGPPHPPHWLAHAAPLPHSCSFFGFPWTQPLRAPLAAACRLPGARGLLCRRPASSGAEQDAGGCLAPPPLACALSPPPALFHPPCSALPALGSEGAPAHAGCMHAA